MTAETADELIRACAALGATVQEHIGDGYAKCLVRFRGQYYSVLYHEDHQRVPAWRSMLIAIEYAAKARPMTLPGDGVIKDTQP